MATTTNPTTEEVNPFTVKIAACDKLKQATERRLALYTWLRAFKDDYGIHEVSERDAYDIASAYSRRYGKSSGFSPEECAHINGELDAINELTQEAYPHFRSN